MDVEAGSGMAVVGGRLADFAVMAEEMARSSDLEPTLEAVVEQARLATLCHGVGVMLIEDRHVTVAATSGPDVLLADKLQLECDEGPCLEALDRARDFICDDLGTDGRWPVWGRQVADLGWSSILSVALTTTGKAFGALNLYSREPSFFSLEDLAVAEVFARHASIALGHARERQQLREAVDSRTLIGQAQGILMERYGVDADRAFTVLRRYSSQANRKLRLVAEEVVRERRLPGGAE